LPFDQHVLHFIREFGLILFVFSIGLQVGPGFFSNFKEMGMTLNFYAMLIVFIGFGLALLIKWSTGLPADVMVGILSGAVTNTPGLGAAQQAFKEIPGFSMASVNSGTGYAVAYPFGIMGIIISMILIRKFFKINLLEESLRFKEKLKGVSNSLKTYTIEIKNPMIIGKSIGELAQLLTNEIVISRHFRSGYARIANDNQLIEMGDLIHIVCKRSIKPVLFFSNSWVLENQCPWGTHQVLIKYR